MPIPQNLITNHSQLIKIYVLKIHTEGNTARKSQDKSLICPYFNLLFTLFPPVHLHIIVPVTWIDVYLTDRNL